MTKAQQIYEQVEAIVATGGKKADAFRQVADEIGQPFNSVRGAYYSHTRSLSGSADRPRRREQAPADPIEAAIGVLTRALGAIDEEVEAAKSRAEEAEAAYRQLRAGADERKALIKAKIEALNSQT